MNCSRLRFERQSMCAEPVGQFKAGFPFEKSPASRNRKDANLRDMASGFRDQIQAVAIRHKHIRIDEIKWLLAEEPGGFRSGIGASDPMTDLRQPAQPWQLLIRWRHSDFAHREFVPRATVLLRKRLRRKRSGYPSPECPSTHSPVAPR